MNLKNNFHFFALITIVFWSSAFVFTRLALKYFTPISLGFLRYIAASASLIVIALIIKIKMPQKSDIKWFLLAGFFGFFFYMIVFNFGTAVVSAATSSVILASAPIITTLLARIFFKEKIKAMQYAAIIIEFIGVGVLAFMNGVLSINIGVIWLLLASISVSIYNVIQRKITKKYSAIQTAIISIWFGTLMLFVFLPNSVGEVKEAPLIQILYLIFLGVFPSAIAYITWTYAFSKAQKASSVTNYMFLIPFLTAILGFLIINEVPDMPTIIGGIIILFGMFIFNFSEKINRKTDSICD